MKAILQVDYNEAKIVVLFLLLLLFIFVCSENCNFGGFFVFVYACLSVWYGGGKFDMW
jgi:hypothetical protein